MVGAARRRMRMARAAAVPQFGMAEFGMKVVLISTYELGRQPFGLASPAAWLREAGIEVACLDLSRSLLSADPVLSVRAADLIAFYLPMHTATRLAVETLPRVRDLNPRAHLCFYGLYAPLNETYLRRLGAQTILGGEFEEGLTQLVQRLATPDASGTATRDSLRERAQLEPVISMARQRFRVPDRSGLPGLERYARLELPDGERRVTGYTEATRGCKHHCRHCPIVSVYEGKFRIVQRDVVLADIRQQVAAGAAHITFGDPDFFNGVGHSLAIVEALHCEHPRLTYDATIKIEHLLRYAHLLQRLRETGCLFVTTAVECLDDRVLGLLDKGHTREDFLRVVELFREVGLALSPTFIPFHPWTTAESYGEMLATLGELGLAESIAPVQLAIRLLIPAQSKLLELPEIRASIGEFDERELSYRWTHRDASVERLHRAVQRIVALAATEVSGQKNRVSRTEIFSRVSEQAATAQRETTPLVWRAGTRTRAALNSRPPVATLRARATIPYLSEPWFC